ncbi:MAG: hypothetical protein R2874_01885 [Desulfobacterales bacterium]
MLTTHYMGKRRNNCERIIIVDNGRILKQGTLEQLVEDSGERMIDLRSMNQQGDTPPVGRGGI